MKKFFLFGSCLVLSLLAGNAGATNQFWDNNGTSAATSGTWDTTTKNWASSSTLATGAVAFTNGNFPEFSAGSGTTALTITVNSPVTCAGMYDRSTSTVTFSGTGSIGITSGLQGFLIVSGASIVCNVPLTGPGGVEQESSGSIALYATNTYTGGTDLTGGQVTYYNNTGSFGTGPITVAGSGQALVNGGTSAVVITNDFVFPTAGYAFNLAGGNPVAGTPGTTFTGNFPLPSSGTINLETSSTATTVDEITGVISGASALTISDNGTMELGGINTYTGNTTISSPATLSIVGSGSLGSGAYAGTIANASKFIYGSSASQTLSGAISGAGTLTVSGPGTLTLSTANTYTGNTAVNGGGTLALAGTGSIAATANLVIGPGGTFDVSALDPFMWNSGTTFNATGTGTTPGSTAAALNDSAAGGVINLNANQINLSFTPASFTGDVTHPSLVVPQGALTLNDNQIIVTNAAATALGVGTYNLIQVGDGTTGTISGAPNSNVIVEGAGLAPGAVAVVSVAGSEVVLTVSTATNTTTTTLSALAPITYGSPVTATATVSPVPNSGQVQFFVNGAPLGSPVTVDTGTGLASYNYTSAANTPAGSYSITATYSGSTDGAFSVSTATAVTLVINKVALTVTANAQTVTYGTAATTGTGKTTFTSSGLQNSETIGSVTLTAGGTGYISTNTPVGSNYTITPSAATGGTFTAANYTITYSVGNLTVTAKALTITASAESMTYGQTYTGFGTLKTTNFTGSGFVNGQAAGSMTVTLTCPNGTATTPAGAYAGSIVTGTAAELSGKTNFNPGNYTITYVNGNFTVNKAAATVTATPQTIVYGTAVVTNGSANFTTSTLSNSETIGSVTLSLSGATAGTNVITPGAATGGSGTEANYNITYITNSLVVTPLPVVLTGTRAYDGTGTATNLILTVSNVVGGDDVNVSAVPGFAVLAGANVGPENITDFSGLILGGVTSTNYTLAGASGSVTITNPYNPFMITSSHLDATGTNFVVAWDSVPGVIYTIMTNSDLTTTNWAAAGGSVTATNSSTTSSFPVAPDGSTRMFVRIKQQ